MKKGEKSKGKGNKSLTITVGDLLSDMPYLAYPLFFINFNSFSFLCILWNLFSSADSSFHLIEEIRIRLEELFGVLTSLPELGLAIRVECSCLLHDTAFNTKINDLSGTRDTLVEHDVYLNFTERWSNLVLHDFYLDPISHRFLVITSSCFELFLLADLEAL